VVGSNLVAVGLAGEGRGDTQVVVDIVEDSRGTHQAAAEGNPVDREHSPERDMDKDDKALAFRAELGRALLRTDWQPAVVANPCTDC
jgi:hypothetical protein